MLNLEDNNLRYVVLCQNSILMAAGCEQEYPRNRKDGFPIKDVGNDSEGMAADLLAYGAYSQYVSTAKGRQRRWRPLRRSIS